MTIKSIIEKYRDYKLQANERNMFTTYDYNDGNGKVVIVVNDCKGYGKTVMQVVRVSDGVELLPEGTCRPCDNLDDAIDVAGEMEWNGMEGNYMTRAELQKIGNDIINRQKKLLSEHREEWELGRYTINKAWEDAVKEICLLN